MVEDGIENGLHQVEEDEPVQATPQRTLQNGSPCGRQVADIDFVVGEVGAPASHHEVRTDDDADKDDIEEN